MTESDRRRLITSTPHLSPDEIVQRSFTTSFRGYSEAEVRAFLKRVSEELVVTQRARGRVARQRSTRSRSSCGRRGRSTSRRCSTRSAPRRPGSCVRPARPPTRSAPRPRSARPQLVDEAQRGGRARHDRGRRDRRGRAPRRPSARRRARERGRGARGRDRRPRPRPYSEAQQRARRARGRRDRSRPRVNKVARCSTRRRRRASACSRISRAGAACCRRRSKRCARGRDNLLDAYRVVKRTFLEATDALAQVEARAAAERAAAHENDTTTASRRARRGARDATEAIDVIECRGRARSSRSRLESRRADRRRRRRRRRRRPRRRRLAVRAHPRRADRGARSSPLTDAATATEPSRRRRRGRAEADTAGSRPRPSRAAEPEAAEVASGARCRRRDEWRARRAEVLDPLLVTVAKRAKRAAQDDQNALARRGAPAQGPARPRRRCSYPRPSCCAAWVGCAARRDRRGVRRGPGRGRRRSVGRRRRARARGRGDDRHAVARAHRVRDRHRRGRRHQRSRRTHRRPLPRMEEPVARGVARRRARAGVVPRRLRRVARRRGAALDPVDRGPLRRLRRQRAGTDGEGLDRSRPVSCTHPLIAGAAACSRLSDT